MFTIVKLGGSIVTDKRRAFSFRPEVVSRLAEEIRISGCIPIIVHGTGRAGKAYARHYTRPENSTSRWMVFQLTTKVIRQLQAQISDVFFAAGVPNCSIPSNALFRQNSHKVYWHDHSPIFHLVQHGIAPILCGDVLVEDKDKFRIVSSDLVMLLLAERLPVEKAVFVTDVDGVLAEDGRLVPLLCPAERVFSRASDGEDITGGMAVKAEVAFKLATLNVPVIIVNGLVASRLRAALRGEPTVCTRVQVTGNGSNNAIEEDNPWANVTG